MNQLLIFPCNGNGQEAAECLDARHRFIAFVDDTPTKQGHDADGRRVGTRELLTLHAAAEVLAVPGSPASFRDRARVILSLGVNPERFARVIHPGAHVSPRARLGRNVLVMAGVVITSNAVIGDHVCILPNTVIHHDVQVGDWTLIGANVTIAGNVTVGENCYIGSGSSVINGIALGARTLVGLGSTVIRNTDADAVVAGSPARRLR